MESPSSQNWSSALSPVKATESMNGPLLTQPGQGRPHEQRLDRVTGHRDRDVPQAPQRVHHHAVLLSLGPRRVKCAGHSPGPGAEWRNSRSDGRRPAGDYRSQDRQVVAVHDLALVRRTELAGQLARRAAQQGRQLGGVVVHQAAGDHAALRVEQVDRVPGDERPADGGDPGRQQRGAALDERRGRRRHRAGSCPCPRWRARATAAGSAGGARWRGTGCRPARRRAPHAAWSAPVRTTGMPAPVAIRAASSLVAMPPVPRPRAGLADGDAGEVGLAVDVGHQAARAGVGRAVVQAVDVGEEHAAGRRARGAPPSAASRSLSPNLISVVATVSFSLTIGTTPRREQRHEGPLGVAVVAAAGHVVER